MSTLKLSLVALCLFMAQLSFAQTGQMVFYFTDNLSTTYIDNVATSLGGGIVITYPQPGGNIGIIETTFPYVSPYTGTIIVDGAGGARDASDNDPEIDGGNNNLNIISPYDTPKPPSNYDKCYNLADLDLENGPNRVHMSLYDTGLDYNLANLNGYNFTNVTEINGPVMDDNDHGSHTGGLVNQYMKEPAGQNNVIHSYYIANPFNASGSSTLGELLIDIEFGLVNYQFMIVNNSYSYLSEKEFAQSDPLYLLIKNYGENVLFVCSAGNLGNDMDDWNEKYASYPAAFDLPQILTVASHSCSDQISEFSNYGYNSVDIAAPGESIESSNKIMERIDMSGTSQASAITAGVAGMLASHQVKFDALEIKCAIMTGGTYNWKFSGKTLSAKKLNAEGALANLFTCTPSNPPNGPFPGGARSAEKVDRLLNISPNPFMDIVNIDVELVADSPIQIRAFDMSGRVITERSFIGNTGENNLSLNLENLSAENMIFVQISTNEFSTIEKLIKIQ